MNRFLRAILYGLAALAVLVLAAVVVLPLVFEPNDYKDELTALVAERTGRALDIEGDLKLSVFPWLGVETGAVRLGSPRAFGDTPFAEVRAARLRVRLWPLFSGRVEADTLSLDGLRLKLVRDRRGRDNWSDWGGAAPEAPAAGGEGADDGAGLPLAGFALGGIRIEDASLEWEDRAAGSRYRLAPVSLRTGPVAPGRPVDVRLSVGVEAGDPALRGGFELDTRLTWNPELTRIGLAGLEAGLDLEGDGLPDGRLRAELRAEADMDLAAGRAVLDDLRLRLDESSLTGRVEVRHFDGPSLAFDLELDRLDLDRYLAGGEAAPADPAAAGAAAGAALPLEPLRGLRADGRLRIGSLKASGLQSQDIEIGFKAAGGRLRLHPATARLYDGRYQGDVRLDVRGREPRIQLDEKLLNVNLGPLLEDLVGQARLQGRADLGARLSAHGADAQALTRTANGSLSFKVRDGAYQGVNLAALIRTAQARLEGRPPPGQDGPVQTDFAELSGSAQVVNGVIDNRDLVVRSPLLRARGEGRVDLPAARIDYLLRVQLVKSLEGQGAVDDKLKGVEIPVEIKGPLNDPKVRPRLDKVLKKKAKKKLKKKLEKKLDKKLKDLPPGVGDALKGLFGR